VLQVAGDAARVRLAKEIVRAGLSVREAERRARKLTKGGGGDRKRGERQRGDPVARRAEEVLSRAFGTTVGVRLKGKASGEIRLPFRDAGDFERIVRRLLAETEAAEIFEDG
jgi:ParB-like chromosome segregation protein Spo0J